MTFEIESISVLSNSMLSIKLFLSMKHFQQIRRTQKKIIMMTVKIILAISNEHKIFSPNYQIINFKTYVCFKLWSSVTKSALNRRDFTYIWFLRRDHTRNYHSEKMFLCCFSSVSGKKIIVIT